MIVIVDYGVGNLRSILSKFERMKIEASISDRADDIKQADKLVLPGIGHFGAGMTNLINSGLIPLLEDRVLGRKTPLLGICLGMQMLMNGSEESPVPGLGWVPGVTRKFVFPEKSRDFRVPHMGWNTFMPENPSPLLTDIAPDARFYFAHSYFVTPDDPGIAVATTWYGSPFTSMLQQENLYGAQFHPEKSHQAGLQIIRNFALYCA